MRKYWFVFALYWQEGLQQRASFLMERFRALVVLASFYYFWSALLAQRPQFAGYDRSQMLTYLLGMNILRSLVFASRTYEIASEINRGRVSAYLLKPINFMAYTFSRDLAEKSINFISAVIEVFGLSLLFRVPIRWPHDPATWLLFGGAAAGATLLYFFISFMGGCWGFWTAESGGPRFLLDLSLEFTAGAFFPLDVLPPAIQEFLKLLPSPYLVFFPLHVFLEKLTSRQMIEGFMAQLFWILVMAAMAQLVWSRGIRVYEAEGS